MSTTILLFISKYSTAIKSNCDYFSRSMQAATLGSQEGAFDNVRLNFSGDQGQTIRQLVSGHCVKREAMCALLSQNGKRQHLCVNHEKGKLTVLQLFPILKQADSNRRKLTLTVSVCVCGEWVGGGRKRYNIWYESRNWC